MELNWSKSNCAFKFCNQEVSNSHLIFPLQRLGLGILERALRASDEQLKIAAARIEVVDYKTVSIIEFEKFWRRSANKIRLEMSHPLRRGDFCRFRCAGSSFAKCCVLVAPNFEGTKPTMKKTFLLVALALCASVGSAPASAQDTFGIDAGGYNHLLNYAQIKHKSPGALDPLSARNRYLKQKGRRTRRTRSVRATRRYSTSRPSNTRRSRPTYRTIRRTSYRLRR